MTYKKVIFLLITTGLVSLPLVAFAGLQAVPGFEGTASGDDLMVPLRNIVNALLTFAAVVAVIFIIIGGVRYVISQGDEDAQILARNTILYAIIGIIVIALSAVIINYILTNI